jgi:hypothetical protein
MNYYTLPNLAYRASVLRTYAQIPLRGTSDTPPPPVMRNSG